MLDFGFKKWCVFKFLNLQIDTFYILNCTSDIIYQQNGIIFENLKLLWI